MEKKVKSPKQRLLHPTRIYTRVLRSFVTHYCEGFSWQLRVLGLIRSKDFQKLLETAESINSSLIDSCTRGEDLHTEYGDASKFSLASQFVALVTKYQFSQEEIPDLDPVAAALEDFLKAERRNRRLNLVFAAHLRRGSERHWCIPMIRDVFCRVLGRTPPFEDILQQSDFSGGAGVGISGDATHMGNKLCASSLRGTANALSYFKTGIFRNKHYLAVLTDDDGSGFFDDQGEISVLGDSRCFEKLSWWIDSRFEMTEYDEIKVVPKKAKSGRTIGKTPPVNNFVQLGCGSVMRSLLVRKMNLDLTDQFTNQELARKGSDPDILDPYVTIDIRGASNSVLTQLVRSVTPPRWFKLLDHTRTHNYRLPDSDEIHGYEMFVSMGNGFCFPLESLLFGAIVISAYKYAGAIPDYRVYGDDIICRQSVALVVIECLRACGFRTNVDKTYIFGPFRESCGANWYDGRLVTPGYFKERITTVSGLHTLHNALAEYPLVQADIRAIPHGTTHAVPDTCGWSWVTDQAFRVPHDVLMTVAGTFYARSIQSFVYPIMVTTPVADPNWPVENALSSWRTSQLSLAAALRGSTYAEPFHFRRSTTSRSSNTLDPAVAIMRNLEKKVRAFEAFVGPHRTDYTTM